jgi:hypothetical protein
MKKIALVLILCLLTCSFSTSFAAVSTMVQSDGNSIKVSGTSDDDNIMLYLLRPQKTVEDLEAAFISGNLSDTVAHYRQLEVLDGRYEYTIAMSDTDEKGEYLLCVGNEKPVVIYYAPMEYRMSIAMQVASAQNGSNTYEIINDNKQYFGINLTLYDALAKKSFVGDLTYEQLKGVELDENDKGYLTTVVGKINQSIMIAALNEGIISDVKDVSLSQPNDILELKEKITSKGKGVLLKNLSKQNFSSYAAFVDAFESQLVLQAINYPADNNSEFLLSVLSQYYDRIGLNLSEFNSLSASKKATAVNKLSESKCSIGDVGAEFNKIVLALSSTSVGGPSSSVTKGKAGEMNVTIPDGRDEKPVKESTFSDLSNYEWAAEAIEFLAEKSVIIGYNGEFMPANKITRAEFTTIVVRAFYDVSAEYEQVFEDVPADNWAFAYIMCAYEKGIVSGIDKNHFNPNSSITREDMVKILYNIISDNNTAVTDYDVFDDDNEISDYAKNAVYALKSSGIINGMNDNTFAPKALAARAEAAKLIYNFMNSQYANAAAKKQPTTEKENISVSSKRENVLNLLVSLGMIDGTFDFNYNAEIKKGYFAQMAACIKGMPEGYKATGEVFSDVSLTNEYAPAIEFLAQLGVLGNEQNFRPNESITLSEAVRIILGVTDYSYFAEEAGGYPNGYYSIAAKKRLLSGVECGYDDILLGGDMVSLLFNSLKLNIVNITGTNSFEEDTALTILEKLHNVFSHRGIIVANSLTTFYSESDLPENSIQLNSGGKYINLNCGTTDISNEIGGYATVYYRYDEALDKSVCLYYEMDKGMNEIVTISLDDVEDLIDNSISYYDDEDEKKVVLRLDENYSVIYNGTYHPDKKSFTKEFLDNKNGEISLVDNNSDGNYDVLRVVAYETYVVNNVLSKSSILFDKYDSNIAINIDKSLFDEYSLTFADGTQAVIEDLVNGTVISVAANDNRCMTRVIKLIASDRKISGVITEVEQIGETTTIILDNSDKYRVYKKAEGSLPGVGSGIIAYLDAFSNIAYIGNNNTGVFQYGLVIASHRDKGLSGKVSMKIYGSSLKSEVYSLAPKAVIDGTKCKSYDEAYTKLSMVATVTVGSSNLPSGVFPVRYKLNDNNEISELDTPTVGTGEDVNSLTHISSSKSVFSSDGCLGFSIPTDTTTIHINIRTTNLSDKAYLEDDNYLSYGSATSMTRGDAYNIAAYKVENSSPYAALIITYNGYGMSYNHTFLTVNKVYKVYDEDTNEVLSCVEGVINGAMKKVKVSPKYESTFEGLKLMQGDVIRYDTDYLGHLVYVDSSKAVVKYNKQDNTVTVTLNNINKGQTALVNVKEAEQSTHVFHGYVKSREEGLIEFVYASGGSGETINVRPSGIDWDKEDSKTNILYAQIYASTPVTVYDPSEKENHRVYAGTYDDIADYVHNGDAYSRVLLRYRSAELKEVVVFNDASLAQ